MRHHRSMAVLAAVLGSAVPALVLAASPAAAAGTGGVEITPVAGRGSAGSAFHVRVPPHAAATASFDITNLTDAPVSARIYAASVVTGPDGYAIGGPGSAPWIGLPDQVVRLEPHTSRRVAFAVSASAAKGGGEEVSGAVVEAPTDASSLLLRVATLVYVETSPALPAGRGRTGRPLIPAALAALALAGLVTALCRCHRT